MRPQKPHVLLVGHQGTRTGAPIMLLRTMDALADQFSFKVLLATGGPLVAEFQKRAPTVVLAHPFAEATGYANRVFRKFWDKPVRQKMRVLSAVRKLGGHFDLIHNNTTANGRLVKPLTRLGIPIVTHVHELGPAITRINKPRHLTSTVDHTRHFVAVSDHARHDLVNICKVQAHTISVVPNFLPKLPAALVPAEREEARRRLGMAKTDRVVCACGGRAPGKGEDLFHQVALRTRARLPEVRFMWVGGYENGKSADGAVEWVSEKTDIHLYQELSDVVMIPSWYESFSLVALEAAALGTAVVAFEGARGPTELLASPDLLAPGHDVDEMAKRLIALLSTPGMAAMRGAELRRRVADKFLAEHCAPQLAKVWSQVLR